MSAPIQLKKQLRPTVPKNYNASANITTSYIKTAYDTSTQA